MIELIDMSEPPKKMWCVLDDFSLNGEITLRFNEHGSVENDMELLYLLGYKITEEVESTDEELIYNCYEGIAFEKLEEYDYATARKATDKEIEAALYWMRAAITAYQEQDLEEAYKINGIEYLLRIKELEGK